MDGPVNLSPCIGEETCGTGIGYQISDIVTPPALVTHGVE
jgi:hypothetical protein